MHMVRDVAHCEGGAELGNERVEVGLGAMAALSAAQTQRQALGPGLAQRAVVVPFRVHLAHGARVA